MPDRDDAVSMDWSDARTLRALIVWLVALAGVALVAGYSRMHPTGWQMGTFGDILRYREAMSMFLFAPAISLCFWQLVRALGRGRPSPLCMALAVLSIYFIACGMGMHDPMNRIQGAYAAPDAMSATLRTTIVYFDDRLGHWVFWWGYALGTWVLGIQQVLSPLDRPIRPAARWILAAVTLATLWVMLTNLWDEYPQTLADLCVIAAAVLVPTVAWLTRRVSLFRLPVLLVIIPAFWGSIIGTLLCWTFRYWLK
ncbi:MAG: hypothetical protein J6336_11465 [Kiritimatiellae bacterium]|nr:hypothetical protein [Kiritimatiellia bacterium]